VETRPGGPLAKRPLHFFWIIDCSGSMSVGGKMQSLNTAAKEAIPHMRDAANENPNAQVYVRVLKFGNSPTWESHLIELEQFNWRDLKADQGTTSMGAALRELAGQLGMPPMPDRALPPVLLMMSDGQPTDNFRSGLSQLMSQPWGSRAVRIAIAIGRDADRAVLQEFIGNPELKPLEANNSEALTRYIRWASTQAIKSASSGGSSGLTVVNPTGNVPLPVPPKPATGSASATVW